MLCPALLCCKLTCGAQCAGLYYLMMLFILSHQAFISLPMHITQHLSYILETCIILCLQLFSDDIQQRENKE